MEHNIPQTDEQKRLARVRHSIGFGLLTILVVILCGPFVVPFISDGVALGVWRDPPTYPAPQGVTRKDFGNIGRSVGEDNVYLMKRTTFTTADPPEQIERFYSEKFTGVGWKPSGWTRLQYKDADTLDLAYTGRGAVYFINVVFTAADSDAGFEVRIDSSMFPKY